MSTICIVFDKQWTNRLSTSVSTECGIFDISLSTECGIFIWHVYRYNILIIMLYYLETR